MIKIKDFKKRLAIGAASLLLLSPIALTSFKASQAHASSFEGQQVNNYVMDNVPQNKQQSHNLVHFWDESDPSYSRPQLRYVYQSTYNNTHQDPKSNAAINAKTEQLTDQELMNKLANLEQNIERQINQMIASMQNGQSINQVQTYGGDHIHKTGHGGFVNDPPMTKAQARREFNTHKDYNNESFAQFIAQRAKYRHPEVESNFRDMGGYETRNGKFIKPGRIIRSNNFHYLTRRGGNEMHRLGVHKVIDLRNANQANHRPDKTFLHAQLNPVFTAKQTRQTSKYAKAHHLSNLQHEEYNYNHLLTNNPLAEQSYRNTFNALLNNRRGSVAYHCIAGRDRTGITSILILNALGVPKNTAIRDYLLSNVYEHNMPLNQQYQLVQAFYHAADSKYGSVRQYLVHGVGINNAQIHQLQKMYLTK